jgi:UDP-N-acetylglucosamine--N-acetylmuramyl-(pentapeptide) pyrophosphoryl-undecaprenol N-acetylglucosamine transferase
LYPNCALCAHIYGKYFKNKKDIEYILISGKRYFKNYERYNFIYNNLKVIESTDKILEYMNKCDLIISRAGATTISEIISLEKPSILIPSPNVSNNHQEYNADGLFNKNACIKINEENINIEEINKEINNILYDNNVIKNIKEELRKLNKSNVCKKIVSESINKLNE